LPPPHTCTPLPHHHTNTDTTNGADTDAQKTGDAAAHTGTGTGTDQAVSPLHHTLTHIWERVLGLPVTADSDVFELGAHSFAIAKVKARIAVALRIDLPPRVFFTSRTVVEQAEVLLEKASSPQALLRRAAAVAALPRLDDQEWVAAVTGLTVEES
ncbi:acyl carrier protein, partial [Streptosporangium carneum]